MLKICAFISYPLMCYCASNPLLGLLMPVMTGLKAIQVVKVFIKAR